MAIQSRSLSYDDLQRLRETRDERLELIDGELFVTPSPTPLHQYVSGRLQYLFQQRVRELGFGLVFNAPLDVRLAKHTIVQPDLIIILPDRRPIVTGERVEGAPSLVVEILSPSTRTVDRTTKRDVYALYGVPEYWLVDTEARTVTLCSDPHDGRYRVERVTRDSAISEIIPGMTVDLTELFAPIPEA
ncbi:MAG: Uma2 family endonuclease [Chloroflexi bacterium]|nr:Uma2 family endonuclease [Chloroflexota bacterium]